ncbi:MAG: IS110 family transposase [Collinsella sp.]
MEGETVIAGVDTHKDVHVLCLLDGLGRKIRSGSFGADPEGYDRLAEAIGDPGSCMVVGVEGTASYGAGLTRRLVELGYNVVEVLRPKRDKARPGEGKSDPLDAERAARKAASGKGCSVPKSQDGWVEAVRQLYVARRLAVATSTSCVACAKSMLTTAPSALRERFRGRERPKDLMPLLARGRKAGDALEESVLASLRSVAAVWKEARSQVESLDERIRALLEANAPALLGVEGCGTTTAALVVAAGDNPGRLKGEAAFSMMCGASPIPASSGKTDRHRLNRGGNRQANWALYEIAIKRMAYDERTRRYVARRTSEGSPGGRRSAA